MKTSNKKSNKKVQKKLALPKKIKAKTKIQTKIKTKKVSPKINKKTKVKIKQVAPKNKITTHKPTKKIVNKKRSSIEAVLGPIDVRPYYFKKNEDYMNKKQLAHFQGILLQWKEELMNDVDRTMHHMKDEASNYPDPVDRASQEEEFSLELRTRDRERKLLKKIDETLMRISDQDYGYCDDCGTEIGIRRLEARPTANQCIECKTIAEIREKQIGENN
ncbi:DnaK suppressor protein [Gammaproteobacteria bacterium]